MKLNPKIFALCLLRFCRLEPATIVIGPQAIDYLCSMFAQVLVDLKVDRLKFYHFYQVPHQGITMFNHNLYTIKAATSLPPATVPFGKPQRHGHPDKITCGGTKASTLNHFAEARVSELNGESIFVSTFSKLPCFVMCLFSHVKGA